MASNPANYIDPEGVDGIVVDYHGYPVNPGYGFNLPLGHGGVIAVAPNTGTTTYFEYGRYGGDFGQLPPQVVPDLSAL